MDNIVFIKQLLAAAGYQSERLFYDAQLLLCKVIGYSPAQALTSTVPLSEIQKKQLILLIHELTILKKPLQYIIGIVPFCGLELSVQPPVLIPRPETEQWVTELIKQYAHEQKPIRILDIGTGSGCIALALAHALSHAQIVGTDCSDEALSLARENQKRLGISNVLFINANLFPANSEQFNIIVSNPPYIAEQEWQLLEPQVRLWEDKQALVADDRGLAIIKRIIDQSRSYLISNGHLILEIGHTQAAAVCTFMRSCGYTNIQVMKDFLHNDRVVIGRYNGISHEMD